MTRANMVELVRTAMEGGCAVGAFNVVTLENAEAIATAAEQLALPVILQVSQNTVDYHHGLAAIGAACCAIAERATVPVAVHLDHAGTFELCEEAASIGFGSVMFDGSHLALDENAARTQEIVEWAHRLGVGVEAELGYIGGKAGDSADGELTDPAQAALFVRRTDVDALAVAVGTSHHMTRAAAVLDIDLIRRLRTTVRVPLVLHGSSGVSDAQLREAVRAGIAKVNVATQMNMAFTSAVRSALDADPQLHDIRRYLGPGRDAMTSSVVQKLALFGRA